MRPRIILSHERRALHAVKKHALDLICQEQTQVLKPWLAKSRPGAAFYLCDERLDDALDAANPMLQEQVIAGMVGNLECIEPAGSA